MQHDDSSQQDTLHPPEDCCSGTGAQQTRYQITLFSLPVRVGRRTARVSREGWPCTRDSRVRAVVLHWCNCPPVASRVPSRALLAHFHDKVRGRFGCVPHNLGDGKLAPCRKAWDIASTASHLCALQYLLAWIPFALSSLLSPKGYSRQVGLARGSHDKSLNYNDKLCSIACPSGKRF